MCCEATGINTLFYTEEHALHLSINAKAGIEIQSEVRVSAFDHHFTLSWLNVKGSGVGEEEILRVRSWTQTSPVTRS